MPDGGDLDVSMETGADGAAVNIRDTGCGIPRQDLERIFDPFFTTKDAGTGLGLVIASNIMQGMNGYIKVTSEPGKGSTFRLGFPLPQAAGAGEQAVCVGPAAEKGKEVIQ
jgi:signal transduction histidine kinase